MNIPFLPSRSCMLPALAREEKLASGDSGRHKIYAGRCSQALRKRLMIVVSSDLTLHGRFAGRRLQGRNSRLGLLLTTSYLKNRPPFAARSANFALERIQRGPAWLGKIRTMFLYRSNSMQGTTPYNDNTSRYARPKITRQVPYRCLTGPQV